MLDKILEKPEEYRRNVAIFATFVVGVAVVAAWLLIAGYNVRQSTFALINTEKPATEEFKNNLPSIRQEGESVVTELEKQNMAASANVPGNTEEKKSIWDKFLGR